MNLLKFKLDNESTGFVDYYDVTKICNMTQIDAYLIGERQLDGLFIDIELIESDVIQLSIGIGVDIHLENYISNIISHLKYEPLDDKSEKFLISVIDIPPKDMESYKETF